MNKERLKKLIYDLRITMNEINHSIVLIEKYDSDKELVEEFSNSLKYKYLSLFIIYEEFISMLLKEYNLYEIAMSIDSGLKKLNSRGYLTEKKYKFFNEARIIRNRIGHRYNQPSIDVVIEFLRGNETIINEIFTWINEYMK